MAGAPGRGRPTATVDDIATIIFSSGSTGEPKGVVLSHFNIDSNVQAIREAYRVLPADRLIGILPLFHSFGYTIFWFAANSGMACDLPSRARWTPTAIGELVQRYAATVLLATPTFLQLYLRRCAPAQFGSIRLVLAGAEKLSESLALAFEDAFGIRPMEGYGMTECAPVVAVNTFDHRETGFFQPGLAAGVRRPAAAGRRGPDRQARHLRTARRRRRRARAGQGAERHARLPGPRRPHRGRLP